MQRRDVLRVVGLLAICLRVMARGAAVHGPEAERGRLPPDLVASMRSAIRHGLDWLANQQRENGSWSNEGFPALTALPLQAFLGAPHPRREVVVKKAVSFVLGHVQEDGGIYRRSLIPGRGGLSTYNTAICMTALHATGNPAYDRIIQNARAFLARSQLTGQDVHAGGFGYGKGGLWRSSDLNNTLYALEAMRLTEDVEDRRAEGRRVDLNWSQAIRYIEQLQNKPDAGEEEAGGFFYKPGKSMAGTTRGKDGKVIFRSYGTMTYIGLLALVYARVDRDDPRVQSAFDWACKHWSLDENPGLGKEGMYFFYHVLTKSLTAFGHALIPLRKGISLNWREAVARRILELQKTDALTGAKYWFNETGRYWESDPVLVTAYMILALEWMLPAESSSGGVSR